MNRRWLRAGFTIAAVLVLFVLTLPVTLPSSLRTRLAAAVGERFGGTVEIESIRVSIFPRLRVAGDAVTVRHEGRTDVPPLIAIESFSADAGLLGLLGRTLRMRRVHLEGLEINVPPGGLNVDSAEDSEQESGDSDDAAAETANAAGGADIQVTADSAEPGKESPLIVDELLSERAVLRILRRTPGKAPREFDIEHLSMEDTGATIPWAFTATLTNPTPPGRIEANGTFGPWNADEPSRTPLAADYKFLDANLGDFDGIRGTLRSDGRFNGVLERIEVEGRTDIPDFALSDVGHPVHLKTTFRALVDGTNGNTWLRPVEAAFRDTIVHATGGVVERDGEDGRTVSLDVVMDEARIEDVLPLAVKSDEPPMTGALKLRAKLELPPGEAPPLEKLRLTGGSFEIDAARFPSGGVQAKVNELSKKAQGDDKEEGPAAEEVASDFTGRFEMGGGAIRFSEVTFTVPGARVDLKCEYAVASEALDFRGTVRLDAKLSQLTTGTKAFILKLVEPLFRRDNVTVVPITIGGTVDQPKFGLDVKRAFTPS
jgi:hypothetical protein